jgi:hypothetical protein
VTVVGQHDIHKVNQKFVVFDVFHFRGFYLKGMDAVPVLGGLRLILFGPPWHYIILLCKSVFHYTLLYTATLHSCSNCFPLVQNIYILCFC